MSLDRKPAFFKLDGTSRARLFALIKEEYPKSPGEIARLAGLQGIATTGGTAVTASWVQVYIRKLITSGELQGPGTPKPIAVHKSPTLPVAVIGILTDPTLSDSQKVRMCLAYAQA